MTHARAKLNKTIRCKIVANTSGVSIKFPKQKIQDLALIGEFNGRSVVLKQWELFITGHKLIVQEVK